MQWVSDLEFNVPFQHKHGYIRDDRHTMQWTKNVFSLRLNSAVDRYSFDSVGSWFYRRGTATEKARSPIFSFGLRTAKWEKWRKILNSIGNSEHLMSRRGVESESSFSGKLRLRVRRPTPWLYIELCMLVRGFGRYAVLAGRACTLLYTDVHLLLEEFRFSLHASWNTQSVYHTSRPGVGVGVPQK